MLDKREGIKIIDNLGKMREFLLAVNGPYYTSDVSYNIRVNDRVITNSSGFLE